MKSACFIVVALVLAIGASAYAQGPAAQKFTVSPEYFYLLDGDARDFYGGGLGVTLGYKVTEDEAGPMYASIGYISLSGSSTGEVYAGYNVDITIMPLMLTKYYSPNTAYGKKLYYGVGAGIVRTKMETDFLGDDTTNDFAWQLVGGMNFNEKWFGEIKYFNGSNDVNTGLTASIGAKF